MSLHSLELNAEDRSAYKAWRRRITVFWGFIVAAMFVVGTILTLDSTLTPNERLQIAQQSGMYP